MVPYDRFAKFKAYFPKRLDEFLAANNGNGEKNGRAETNGNIEKNGDSHAPWQLNQVTLSNRRRIVLAQEVPGSVPRQTSFTLEHLPRLLSQAERQELKCYIAEECPRHGVSLMEKRRSPLSADVLAPIREPDEADERSRQTNQHSWRIFLDQHLPKFNEVAARYPLPHTLHGPEDVTNEALIRTHQQYKEGKLAIHDSPYSLVSRAIYQTAGRLSRTMRRESGEADFAGLAQSEYDGRLDAVAAQMDAIMQRAWPKLTARQQDLLIALLQYNEGHREPATHQNIADELAISRAGVGDHFRAIGRILRQAARELSREHKESGYEEMVEHMDFLTRMAARKNNHDNGRE